MFNRLWFGLCVLTALLPLCFANPMVDGFQKANELYANGKYSEAVKEYQKIAQAGPAAETFYNLGNAYFKDKQIGNAILNYERAKRLNPRDSDIRLNLNYANQLIEYKIEDKRNWLFRQMAAGVDYLRFEECWLLFLGSYFIFTLFLAFSFIRKQVVFGKLGTTLFILLVVCIFPLLFKLSEHRMKDEAIVTVKQAEARYGPSTLDQIAFRLPEGLKVSVEDSKQDWNRIRLKDSRSAWVRSSEMSII